MTPLLSRNNDDDDDDELMMMIKQGVRQFESFAE